MTHAKRTLTLLALALLIASAAADEDPGNGTDTSPEDGGDGSSDDSGNSTVVRNAKIGLIISIAIGTFCTSLLPWVLARLKRSILIMRVCCCAAAGVIIGAAFTHMLPDAEEAWSDYFALAGTSGLRDASDADYPFAMMIAMLVLLLLMAVDKIFIAHQIEGHGHGHAHGGHGHSHAVPSLPQEYLDAIAKNREVSGAASASGNGPVRTPSVSSDDQRAAEEGTSVPMRAIQPRIITSPSSPPHPLESQRSVVGIGNGSPSLVRVDVVCDESNCLAEGGIAVPSYGSNPARDVSPKIEEIRGSREQVAQAWVMAAALALHSIMDGLGIGAETDESGLISMIAAVCGHKLLDGFALGVPVYFARLPFAQTAGVLVVSALMTPLGIGIAWAATSAYEGASAKLAEAILVSMSAGSFFFISLVELLPGGLNDGKLVALKMGITAIGAGAMALLALWV